MKKWEVWTEGYAVTGQRSGAMYHGKFEGETFEDAVRAFSLTVNPRDRELINLETLRFWGCKFYNNGSDARRSFG